MRLISLAVFLITLGAGSIADTKSETDANLTKAIDYRLPETVWPSFYEISLEPYLLESDGINRFKFNGHVFITLRAREENVTRITLHAKNMNITESSFYEALNKTEKLKINVGTSDPETEKFDITLASALNTRIEYILEFEYIGELGNDMHGFYRSYYVNEKMEEVWIGSTQFQTKYARRAFPSFDEPKFKAKFKLSITHPLIYSVVSNTKIDTTIDNSVTNKQITSFKPTPPMSTYLLAFLVSDFRERQSTPNFTVVARPAAFSQTEYAAQVGPKLLAYLDQFTDFPYENHTIGKMHLAAIPDFSAGAMENWGLLTYRETALLYDPKASTALSQQRVATVISHELAHMWFGDLVTCDWWSYTWLNEAFGRYFQYFATHAIENTWELDKQFVVEQIQSVMNMDSLPGTNPMSDITAASPADLSRMFNSISYNKGATIMRMVKHMMTESKFKAALQKYLRTNQFKTSVPTKLFDAFSGEWTNNNVNLTALLIDWTEQVGYPVVTVTLAADGKSFKVSQKRFVLREDAGSASLLWNIPLTYTTDADINFSDTIPKIYLGKTNEEKSYNLSKTAGWIIANIQETGYYRVNYDKNTWQKIRKALVSDKYGGIHEVNRAQLVDDALNFGYSGLIDYELVFDILDYLKTETNYLPWYAAFTGLSNLATRLGTDNEKDFTPYVLHLLDHVYKSVGFNRNASEGRLVTYNRATVLSWACKYGHKDCIINSKKAFDGLMKNNTNVEVNIRSAVYCTAIREGNSTEFDYLWKKFKAENLASEQIIILNALGCSTNKGQLHRYLDLILTNEVRLQDKLAAFQGTFTSNANNVQIVFDYVMANFTKMFTPFASKSQVASILSNIASRFTKDTQHTALQTFIKEHGSAFDTGISTLNKALENVDLNLKWSKGSVMRILNKLRSSAGRVLINTFMLIATIYLIAFTR